MKFEYEVNIIELQMRLQLVMPLKVHEQREMDLKYAVQVISDTMADCGKLLDDIMHIWNSL